MDGTLMQRPDQPAMLAALERLVVTESPSSDKTRCDACADEIAKLFQQRLGVAAIRHRRPDAGDHLEIRIGEGSGPVVLLCHHDTVWPEGTRGRLPFRVQGDRVTGPGSYDMKAGIVEAAFALEQARPRRPVVVLSTSDEEIGSASSRGLIEETARGALAVLVLEPAASGGAIKTARKGIADFILEVDGRAAHAGVEPEKGISAIDELAHQVLVLAPTSSRHRRARRSTFASHTLRRPSASSPPSAGSNPDSRALGCGSAGASIVHRWSGAPASSVWPSWRSAWPANSGSGSPRRAPAAAAMATLPPPWACPRSTASDPMAEAPTPTPSTCWSRAGCSAPSSCA